MANSISIADHITRWGNPSSIALMDPTCKIFSTESVPGIIGYKIESDNIIVFGEPLCAAENVKQLLELFHQQFQDSVKNIIYVAVTEKFTEEFTGGFIQHKCGDLPGAAIGIGQDLVLDPTKDPRAGSGEKASLLRRNCKKAMNLGITIHEYTDDDPKLEKSLNELGEAWSQNRQGPQLYLQDVSVFSHRECKRFFYAKQNDKIIAVLILSRLAAYQGWVINFSMADPKASYSSSDFLMVSALEILGKEDCHFLAIGTIPAPYIQKIVGLKPLTQWCVQTAYNQAIRIFHLTERERYWKKFSPSAQDSYLILKNPKLGISEARGIMSALNASKK